ncbi:MAG TPA: hypothetical protein PL143_10240 [Rhodocyclaceae bacterium]|nr:hypothetical protein [Rhodocyclaceae bacterium]
MAALAPVPLIAVAADSEVPPARVVATDSAIASAAADGTDSFVAARRMTRLPPWRRPTASVAATLTRLAHIFGFLLCASDCMNAQSFDGRPYARDTGREDRN